MSYAVPSDVEEIVDGVLDEIDEPVASRACRVRTPEGRGDKIGYKDLKTQAQDSQRGQDVPPGAPLQESEINYDTITYNAQKQSGMGYVPDEMQIDADKYDIDAVEDAASHAVQQARFNVDSKFSTFVQNFSNAFTTTATFDDTSNSEPYNDIADNVRDAWDADTVLIGSHVLEELRSNPDTKEEISGYSGTGKVSEDVTIDAIRGAHRSIENVYVFDQLFDANALGLDPSQSRLFDDYIAVYHQQMLMMIDPDSDMNPNTRIDDDIDHSAMKVRQDRYVDFLHPISEFGYVADVIS